MRGLLKFEFNLPAEVKKSGKLYVAKCPLLDVYSQGNNKKEALVHLIEAIQLFVESCFERGTLDQVMRDCGFEFKPEGKRRRKVPLRRAANTGFVKVPISVLIARTHAEARAH